jgi:hypothetical protein
VGKEDVLSDKGFVSNSEDGTRVEPIALEGSLEAGLCAWSIVCSGVSPVPSNPEPDVFRAEAPDSMELRLDVLLCGATFCPGAPPNDRFLASKVSGGDIEIVFGLSTGGRIICEAPFRYDK